LSADPRFTFRVPSWVANHHNPLVKQAVAFAKIGFANRLNLGREKRDRWGNQIHGKLFPFLHRSAARAALRPDGRPYKSPAQLARRRADHFQLYLSFWLTCFALTDHDDWVIYEKDHAKAKESPYPSLPRIAELAEMDCSPATVERIRREMHNGGFLSFTKQHRAEREDGKGFFSSGGAFRRLSWKVFASIGGFFGRAVLERVDETKLAKEKRKQADQEFEDRVNELFVEREKLASALEQTRTVGEPAPLPLPSSAEGEAIERLHEQHPDWTFPQLRREAKRLVAAMGAALAPKPNTS
jgi:hypothetical protein